MREESTALHCTALQRLRRGWAYCCTDRTGPDGIRCLGFGPQHSAVPGSPSLCSTLGTLRRLCSDSSVLWRSNSAVNSALSNGCRSESVERKRSNPPEGFNDLKSSLNTASRFQCVRFRPALHPKPESRVRTRLSRHVNGGRTEP